MYELARLEASLSSLNHFFFPALVTYIVVAVVLRILSLVKILVIYICTGQPATMADVSLLSFFGRALLLLLLSHCYGCALSSLFFFLIINWNWCVEYLELLWWINKTFLATRSSRGPFLFFNVYCMIYLHAITWFISICCSYILWLTLFAIRPAKEFLFRSNYNILLSQMLSVA